MQSSLLLPAPAVHVHHPVHSPRHAATTATTTPTMTPVLDDDPCSSSCCWLLASAGVCTVCARRMVPFWATDATATQAAAPTESAAVA